MSPVLGLLFLSDVRIP